ncbi:ABC transporter substrate-binding protein [Paenibacillus residui]|uniref:Thiamine pyrimidine synthase n=1 Tax=Paenibacillus residui TaxID=629724 RepID=A0ABW3DAH9_9BACL
MKSNFKWIRPAWILSLLLSLSLVLSACGGGESKPTGAGEETKPVKVKLQLKWLPQTQFAGYFVALEKGYYREEGLDVEILPGGPDIVPEQQVANGTAHIGNSWVASLLSHQEEGFPLVEIAQISQRSGLVLVSKKSAGINRPEDLKGKKIGSWMGGLEFEILALLDKYGIDADSDVKLTKQGFTMDQFFNDQLDTASALTHNEFPLVLSQGIPESDLNVIDMNDEGVAMLQDNLFANTEWLENNRDAAVKFLRASIRGWADAIENPEAAVDIVMKSVDEGSTTREHQLSMMKAIGELILPKGTDPSQIGRIDPALFKQTADIAYQFGVIKEEADLSKAYTTEIWDSAAK